MTAPAHSPFLALVGAVLLCGCASPPPEVQLAGPPRDPDKVIVEAFPSALPVEEHARRGFLVEQFIAKGRNPSTESVASWEAKQELVSRAMVRKASKAGLDSTSLLKVLRRLAAESSGYYSLPFAAYSTTLNGERAWVIVRAWGVGVAGHQTVGLWHVEADAFTQKGLEPLGHVTCE